MADDREVREVRPEDRDGGRNTLLWAIIIIVAIIVILLFVWTALFGGNEEDIEVQPVPEGTEEQTQPETQEPAPTPDGANGQTQ